MPPVAAVTPASPQVPHAWCVQCARFVQLTRQEGTTDWQFAPVYACAHCGQITRDPVTWLAAATETSLGPFHGDQAVWQEGR